MERERERERERGGKGRGRVRGIRVNTDTQIHCLTLEAGSRSELKVSLLPAFNHHGQPNFTSALLFP